MKYYCTVCGYDALTRPPADYNICPCCGTEFGYDDVAHSLDELRNLWFAKGAAWFSDHTPPPPEWDVFRQIANLAVQSVSGESTIELLPVKLSAAPVIVVTDGDVPLRSDGTTEVKQAGKIAA